MNNKISFESLGQTFQSTLNLNQKLGDFVFKSQIKLHF